ncbi:MAG TPA: nucleoside deaminase [Pseudolabrys sp.]|nr:nucleoside deaminase [Pseudolabrys sp.]
MPNELSSEQRFLCEAIDLARENLRRGGRPFGAVVVKNGAVIATGVNETAANSDPTAHAEMEALRAASRALGSPDLSGCEVYASGHPCPMCFLAMRVSGISRAAYAYSLEDSAAYGLRSAITYDELKKPLSEQGLTMRHVPVAPGADGPLYAAWKASQPSS